MNTEFGFHLIAVPALWLATAALSVYALMIF
jgi:hypothetical protein